MDLECKVCNGTGRERIYECPTKGLDECASFLGAFSLCKMGVWPEGNSAMDNAKIFLSAVTYLESAIGRIESENIKKLNKNNG